MVKKDFNMPLNRLEMPVLAYFEAKMRIGSHLFILRSNKDISGTIQDNWFDSIMEVICLK